MRHLILSDIHGNWEALEAVLADAEDRYDQIICCGDLVGYGADPNAVVAWARKHVATIVRGNHDKACAGLEDAEAWFNPVAHKSALWTRTVLTPENLDYLANLAQGPAQLDGFSVAHGSPLDEDEYLLTLDDVAQVAPHVGSALTFFGHTHIQGGFLFRGRRIGPLGTGAAVELDPGTRYLVNPGSVGQPRDGDPRAAYVIHENRVVEFRRVEYDVDRAAAKILAAGLPHLLAMRLKAGA